MNKIQHFMIDPPWPLKKIDSIKILKRPHSKDMDYSMMSIPEIFKLLDKNIFKLADNPHHVYLWTLEQYLLDAEREMLERGYKRYHRLIWYKANGDNPPAGILKRAHEYLIWFYKPKMIKVEKGMWGKFNTVLVERNRQHSRKPEAAYSFVERLYPNDTKMDVFSRQSRQGWYQFGNQPNVFPEFEKQIRL